MPDWDYHDDDLPTGKRPGGDDHWPLLPATSSLQPLDPQILVLSAPSGGGKSTLINNLLRQDPEKREFIVSYTTRMPRREEVDGKHYRFLALQYLPEGKTAFTASQEEIEAAISKAKAKFLDMVKMQGILFESTSYNNHYYGTPRDALEIALRKNKQLILDVNADGAASLKAEFPGMVGTVFLSTSVTELERRLHARDITPHAASMSAAQMKEAKRVITERIGLAKTSLAEAGTVFNDSPLYDHVIETQPTPEGTFYRVQEEIRSRGFPLKQIQDGKLHGALKLIQATRSQAT